MKIVKYFCSFLWFYSCFFLSNNFSIPIRYSHKSFICRYATSDNVVDLKGKVACEISSADELTLTELMFNGVFKDIKVEELISLLSCFVWQEKINDAAKPREELDLLYSQLQDTARRVAQLQLECKVITEYQFTP
jgi:superfamily II RNA helicase